MAILFIDGFDWIENDDREQYAGRYTAGGTAIGFDAITANLRNGHGRAVELASSRYLAFGFPNGALTTVHVAFAFKYTGNISSDVDFFALYKSGSLSINLSINTSGQLEVKRQGFTGLGTGTESLSVDTWYHIAMKWVCSTTVGSVEIRINGSATPDIDITNANTAGVGTDYDAAWLIGDNINNIFDDFVVADDTGSQAFLGDYDVYTLFPDGAGASAQFTPSAGSNWENVDENPADGDTTYNDSDTLNDKDRFTMDDVPAATDTIYAVQVGALARKDNVGNRGLRTVAYDGTTEGVGTDQSPGTSYGWVWDMYEDHPSGAAAWTESEVNSMEAGYEISS